MCVCDDPTCDALTAQAAAVGYTAARPASTSLSTSYVKATASLVNCRPLSARATGTSVGTKAEPASMSRSSTWWSS